MKELSIYIKNSLYDNDIKESLLEPEDDLANKDMMSPIPEIIDDFVYQKNHMNVYKCRNITKEKLITVFKSLGYVKQINGKYTFKDNHFYIYSSFERDNKTEDFVRLIYVFNQHDTIAFTITVFNDCAFNVEPTYTTESAYNMMNNAILMPEKHAMYEYTGSNEQLKDILLKNTDKTYHSNINEIT